MPAVDPSLIQSFASQKEFTRWLKANHDKQSEIYIRIYKKGSDTPSITAPEALDVALCYGWIDAIRKSFDAQSFLQRYTRRKPKSRWSQINRDNVARLIAEQRMTPHGLAQVDAAKADGRWEAAYASARNTHTVPDDLAAAIAQSPRATQTYRTLTKQNLFALVFRLSALKTEQARARRITQFVQMLERGETLHPNGKRARPEQS